MCVLTAHRGRGGEEEEAEARYGDAAEGGRSGEGSTPSLPFPPPPRLVMT